jgi:hypothetical protein
MSPSGGSWSRWAASYEEGWVGVDQVLELELTADQADLAKHKGSV